MYCNPPFCAQGRGRAKNSQFQNYSGARGQLSPHSSHARMTAVWHGAARLLGTAPCTAHCQKPPPSYSRLCAVSTRQSRPLLRAAPRQRGRFFIIFGPLSAICCLFLTHFLPHMGMRSVKTWTKLLAHALFCEIPGT